ATELYSSQPALTRAIQNLERELGCRLFVRTKSGVEFTNEGQRLFEYVDIAHNQLLKGEEEVSRSISLNSGTIYIGCSITALHNFLFGILDDFRNLHPGVKFKITTGSNNGTIEKLKKGIIDIAFVSTPFNHTKSLSTVTVSRFNDILIAGNNFADLKEKKLTLADIQNYPFICLRHSMQLRQFIDDVFDENGLSVNPDIETDSADILVSMICHNFGLGFVPQGMAEPAINRGEAFRINLDNELPQRKICMVTDPHHPQTNASRELYKLVTNRIRPKTK
ncbi:MAG: LysR family transcriptional regulator, partial [Clostridia bacterium]|nr:LysR family transcriptional regulator [Clostridia bacterium]